MAWQKISALSKSGNQLKQNNKCRLYRKMRAHNQIMPVIINKGVIFDSFIKNPRFNTLTKINLSTLKKGIFIKNNNVNYKHTS